MMDKNEKMIRVKELVEVVKLYLNDLYSYEYDDKTSLKQMEGRIMEWDITKEILIDFVKYYKNYDI
jgi:hypothetical protein